jgi:hypothetical protein
MDRSSRRAVAVLAMLGLLFFQFALAAHACSLAQRPSPGNAHFASQKVAPDHCASAADDGGAALCIAHCGQGDETTGSTASLDAPTPALCGFIVVAPAGERAGAFVLATLRPAARSTSPPPLLLSQRLRI